MDFLLKCYKYPNSVALKKSSNLTRFEHMTPGLKNKYATSVPFKVYNELLYAVELHSVNLL